jgi:hypothetical protein
MPIATGWSISGLSFESSFARTNATRRCIARFGFLAHLLHSALRGPGAEGVCVVHDAAWSVSALGSNGPSICAAAPGYGTARLGLLSRLRTATVGGPRTKCVLVADYSTA